MSDQSNNRVKTPSVATPDAEQDAGDEDAIDIARGDTQIYGATAPAPSSPGSSSSPTSSAGVGDDDEPGDDSSQPRSFVAFGDKQIDLSKMRDSYLGEVISGRFKIVEFIDRGGMGEVYLGLNESVGQKVAVKFLNKKFTADEGLVIRFGNEAKSYARVTHPNAVTLLDYGQHDDGALYIITEFVDGKSLSKTIKEHGLFSPEQVISIGQQCCDVLTAAHNEGVIHRDLKPDNLMLMPGPRDRFMVKVLDFGIAKISDDETGPMTETGAIFGTPEFMAPEQARGDSALPQSDLYALGIILYYMATGRLPFSGKNKFAVLNKHLNDPPPRPSEKAPHADVPPALEAVILKCLNKDASARYASAEDLYEALDDVRDQIGTSRTTSKPPGGKKSSELPEEYAGEEVSEAESELAPNSDVVVDSAKPKVNLGEGLKFDSQIGLDKDFGDHREEHIPVELDAEIDLGAERPTDNAGARASSTSSNTSVDVPVDWDDDDAFDVGPSNGKRFLVFLAIVGLIVAAVVFGPKLLDNTSPIAKRDDPNQTTGVSGQDGDAVMGAGEDVSPAELERILMTGQVLGLLSSAEEHLQAGDVELTRKNLSTAALWMEEGALPAPAREKRVALEKSLARLESLEERATKHEKDRDCLELRKVIPEISDISAARAKSWLKRADACKPEAPEKDKGGSKAAPENPSNKDGGGDKGKGKKPDRDSGKPANNATDPPEEKQPTRTTPPEQKDPPEETTPAKDGDKDGAQDGNEDGGGEDPNLGLPPKTL